VSLVGTEPLDQVCREHGRGGAHRRSRADDAALVAALRVRLGRASGAATTVRELWLEDGFRIADRAALGTELDAVFALEDGLAALRRQKLDPLRAPRADGRMRGAEWWLKLANAAPSRRNEALLCSPVVSDALAAAFDRERDPRAREAQAGALALLVARHFPDEGQRERFARLVGDRHAGVRFFAVQGLAAFLGRGIDLADTDLVERARDGAAGVRHALAQALDEACAQGRVSAASIRAVWPSLGVLCTDSSPETRAFALALGERIGLGSAGPAR